MFNSTQRGDFENGLFKTEFKSVIFVDYTSILATSLSEQVQPNRVALLRCGTDSHLELAVRKLIGIMLMFWIKLEFFQLGLLKLKMV
jgi:hypothetical protein